MSRPRPSPIAILVIAALTTGGWPPPSALAAPDTLRAGQVRNSPAALEASGLEEAIGQAAGLEEDGTPHEDDKSVRMMEWALEWLGARVWPAQGALFGRRGLARRWPRLFDPSDRPFKVLVLAWLQTRPSSAPEVARAIAAAMDAVHRQRGGIAEFDERGDVMTTNAAQLALEALTTAANVRAPVLTGWPLQNALRAEMTTALLKLADTSGALAPLRGAVHETAETMARARESSKEAGSAAAAKDYRQSAALILQALARIQTAQAALTRLRSEDPAVQARALRDYGRWLGWRSRLRRGVPDAVEYQAEDLARAVVLLQEQSETDQGNRAAAHRVEQLLVTRGLVSANTIRAIRANVVPPILQGDIQAHLTILLSWLEALASAEATDGETIQMVVEDIVSSLGTPLPPGLQWLVPSQPRQPRVPLTSVALAKACGTLLGVPYVETPLKNLPAADQAVIAWIPEAVRLIRARLKVGEPLDPEAIYRDLALSAQAYVVGVEDLERRAVLSGASLGTAHDNIEKWKNQAAWSSRSRHDVFEALISRLIGRSGLSAVVSEGPRRPVPADPTVGPEASQMAEVLAGLAGAGKVLALGDAPIAVAALQEQAGPGGWPVIRMLLAVPAEAQGLSDTQQMLLVLGPTFYRMLAAVSTGPEAVPDEAALARVAPRVVERLLQAASASQPVFANWAHAATEDYGAFETAIQGFVARAWDAVGLSGSSPVPPDGIHPKVLQNRLLAIGAVLRELPILLSQEDGTRTLANTANLMTRDKAFNDYAAYAALVAPVNLTRIVGTPNPAAGWSDLGPAQRALIVLAEPIVFTLVERHRLGQSLAPGEVYAAIGDEGKTALPMSSAQAAQWSDIKGVWGDTTHREREITAMITRIEQAVGLSTPAAGLEEGVFAKHYRDALTDVPGEFVLDLSASTAAVTVYRTSDGLVTASISAEGQLTIRSSDTEDLSNALQIAEQSASEQRIVQFAPGRAGLARPQAIAGSSAQPLITGIRYDPRARVLRLGIRPPAQVLPRPVLYAARQFRHSPVEWLTVRTVSSDRFVTPLDRLCDPGALFLRLVTAGLLQASASSVNGRGAQITALLGSGELLTASDLTPVMSLSPWKMPGDNGELSVQQFAARSQAIVRAMSAEDLRRFLSAVEAAAAQAPEQGTGLLYHTSVLTAVRETLEARRDALAQRVGLEEVAAADQRLRDRLAPLAETSAIVIGRSVVEAHPELAALAGLHSRVIVVQGVLEDPDALRTAITSLNQQWAVLNLDVVGDLKEVLAVQAAAKFWNGFRIHRAAIVSDNPDRDQAEILALRASVPVVDVADTQDVSALIQHLLQTISPPLAGAELDTATQQFLQDLNTRWQA